MFNGMISEDVKVHLDAGRTSNPRSKDQVNKRCCVIIKKHYYHQHSLEMFWKILPTLELFTLIARFSKEVLCHLVSARISCSEHILRTVESKCNVPRFSFNEYC